MYLRYSKVRPGMPQVGIRQPSGSCGNGDGSKGCARCQYAGCPGRQECRSHDVFPGWSCRRAPSLSGPENISSEHLYKCFILTC